MKLGNSNWRAHRKCRLAGNAQTSSNSLQHPPVEPYALRCKSAVWQRNALPCNVRLELICGGFKRRKPPTGGCSYRLDAWILLGEG